MAHQESRSEAIPMHTGITIRKAVEADSEQVWALMEQLALFEKYIDIFAITPEIVRERGFRKDPPDFYCLVAAAGDTITGILVYYILPYTARNRPALFMKELYVAEAYRGRHIGTLLMNALREEARQLDCGEIKWSVAPWNEAGKRFYQRLGARQNTDWLQYEWQV